MMEQREQKRKKIFRRWLHIRKEYGESCVPYHGDEGGKEKSGEGGLDYIRYGGKLTKIISEMRKKILCTEKSSQILIVIVVVDGLVFVARFLY